MQWPRYLSRERDLLQNSAITREPVLNLIENYFPADGPAIHTMKMYTKTSEWLNPTEAFDHAISAATLTRCGQVENDSALVYEGTAQYVEAIKSCSWH